MTLINSTLPARSTTMGTVGCTVELAGLKSERSQTMTDTIDDVAAKAAGQEPTIVKKRHRRLTGG